MEDLGPETKGREGAPPRAGRNENGAPKPTGGTDKNQKPDQQRGNTAGNRAQNTGKNGGEPKEKPPGGNHGEPTSVHRSSPRHYCPFYIGPRHPMSKPGCEYDSRHLACTHESEADRPNVHQDRRLHSVTYCTAVLGLSGPPLLGYELLCCAGAATGCPNSGAGRHEERTEEAFAPLAPVMPHLMRDGRHVVPYGRHVVPFALGPSACRKGSPRIIFCAAVLWLSLAGQPGHGLPCSAGGRPSARQALSVLASSRRPH